MVLGQLSQTIGFLLQRLILS